MGALLLFFNMGAALLPLTAEPPPRVAHCITGGVRGFPDPEQASRIARFSRALAGDATPDVFMYLEFNQTTNKDRGTAANTSGNIYTHEQLHAAIAQLSPVAVEFADSTSRARYPLTTACSATSGFGPVCATGTEYVCRFHLQFDKVARCFDLVTRHEAAHGFRYDWVTRLRPDAYFFPLPPSLLTHMRRPPSAVAPIRIPIEVEDSLPRSNWTNAVTDEFAIVPRRHAESYFHARDAINMCAPLGALWRTCPGYWLKLDAVEPPGRDEVDEVDPDPTEHFFYQVTRNSSTWAKLSGLPYAEIVLSYWLRAVRRAPVVNVSELTETQIFVVREDGSHMPGAFVMA